MTVYSFSVYIVSNIIYGHVFLFNYPFLNYISKFGVSYLSILHLRTKHIEIYRSFVSFPVCMFLAQMLIVNVAFMISSFTLFDFLSYYMNTTFRGSRIKKLPDKIQENLCTWKRLLRMTVFPQGCKDHLSIVDFIATFFSNQRNKPFIFTLYTAAEFSECYVTEHTRSPFGKALNQEM